MRDERNRLDAASHDARRMHDEFFRGQSADAHIAPHLRAACENGPAAALGGGQGMLGVFELGDLAIDILALASPAVAGLAAVSEADAVIEQRVEKSLAVLGR